MVEGGISQGQDSRMKPLIAAALALTATLPAAAQVPVGSQGRFTGYADACPQEAQLDQVLLDVRRHDPMGFRIESSTSTFRSCESAPRPSVGSRGAYRDHQVPVDDSGDDEVQARGAELLRLGASLADPPLMEGANHLGQRMTLLALVQAGMAAPAQVRTFQPVQHYVEYGEQEEKPNLSSPLPTMATRHRKRKSRGVIGPEL